MRALGALMVLLALSPGVDGAGYTAEQLISKVVEAQKTSGFRVRARLVRTTAGAKKPEVTQLLIKGRREGQASWILYQALWPDAVKGQALVVRKAPGEDVSGFLFAPPETHTPLSPALLRQPLFGSDLTAEDAAEVYWYWPSQKLAGEEVLDGRGCVILESRPRDGAATAYSLVRSWIAPDLALPLRIEKYGKDGKVLKRFTLEKLRKQPDGRWIAAVLVVVPAGGHSQTTLEGVKSDRDLDVPAADFTPEGLRK